jgi:hypothetical protein
MLSTVAVSLWQREMKEELNAPLATATVISTVKR